MLTKFLAEDSTQWHEMLAACQHDFYHLPGYVRMCAGLEEGCPAAFYAEERDCRLLIPLILRPIPDAGASDYFDATCPYGYAGPLLLCPPGEETFLPRALAAFLEALRAHRIVTAFLRLHPLLPLPPSALAGHGELVAHGETVQIDLTLPDEEIWRQTRDNHRRDIHKAQRAGLVAEIDHDWAEFEAFLQIYYQTMDRVGASDCYYFPRSYFTDLRRLLGDRVHLCVARLDGRVVSAVLFTEWCGIVQYHLGGTLDDMLSLQPAKTVINFIRCQMKARGMRVLHLGGGVGGSTDPLFFFKAGFSSLRSPFFTWRLIANEAVYAALVSAWEAHAGQKADSSQGFFPAYRKPIRTWNRLPAVGPLEAKAR
jgi:hypothetical protein